MTKNRTYLILFIALAFYACKNGNHTKENATNDLSNYDLVEDWPQLSPGFVLSPVSGVAVDNEQNVFILQRTGRHWTEPFPDSLISANTIFLLDRLTGKILNSWGSNLFIMPHGLTVDTENNVWVADVGLHQIFKFSHDGQLLMKLGEANIPLNDSMHFNLPTDVAVAGDGSFYVSDGYGNSRVVKFSKEGKYLFEWGQKGDKPGEFNTPHMIDLDANGNVYVADRENSRIQKFSADGRFLKEWRSTEAIQLYSLTVDKGTSRLFAVDLLTVNDTLVKGSDIIQFDSTMTILSRIGRSTKYSGPLMDLHDIAVDDDESIYVCGTEALKLFKFKKVGTFSK